MTFNLTIVDETWRDAALCAQTDPEAFFPEKGGSTREAKKVCARCEVRAECLEYALAHDERFGVWGGLTERARRRMRDTVAVDTTILVESTFLLDDTFTTTIGETA